MVLEEIHENQSFFRMLIYFFPPFLIQIPLPLFFLIGF